MYESSACRLLRSSTEQPVRYDKGQWIVRFVDRLLIVSPASSAVDATATAIRLFGELGHMDPADVAERQATSS
jgi:hypothetical protein